MRTTASAPSRAPGNVQPTGRRWRAAARLCALVLVAALLSVAVGTRTIGPHALWTALLDAGLGSEDAVIVRQLRVPRTALGLLAGLALGIAGALLQGHPQSAGRSRTARGNGRRLARRRPGHPGARRRHAGRFRLVCLRRGTGRHGRRYAVGAAGRGGATPLSLALAGAALSALLYAAVRAVLVSDQQTLDAFRFSVVGGLAGRGADVAAQVAPFIAVGVVLAVANAPALNLLAFGEDVARGLGCRVGAARAVGLAVVTLLCGAATAACGPIAFVGLVVPHVVRAFTGPDHRWLIPCSGLLGAALLLNRRRPRPSRRPARRAARRHRARRPGTTLLRGAASSAPDPSAVRTAL